MGESDLMMGTRGPTRLIHPVLHPLWPLPPTFGTGQKAAPPPSHALPTSLSPLMPAIKRCSG